MGRQLIFLGTGAGCGVPAFYCGCRACQEAQTKPRFQRTRCSIIIQGETNILVDAPPDLRTQLLREEIQHIEHLFLTHWHYDHFAGLGELEFYVRLIRQAVLPVYVTMETKEKVESAFGHMVDCLEIQPFACGEQVDIDGLAFTALDVQHAPGTYGLLLETRTGRRIAYLPDTGPLPGKTARLLHEIEVLILDATFWGRSWMPDVHQSVESAIQLGLALDAGEIYLTHLSMHYDRPVTNQELQDFLSDYGNHVHAAYDGLRLDL